MIRPRIRHHPHVAGNYRWAALLAILSMVLLAARPIDAGPAQSIWLHIVPGVIGATLAFYLYYKELTKQ